MKIRVVFHDKSDVVVEGAATHTQDGYFIVVDGDDDNLLVVPEHNIRYVGYDYDV